MEMKGFVQRCTAVSLLVPFLLAAVPLTAEAGHYHHGHKANPVAIGIVAGTVALVVGVASFFGWRKRVEEEETNRLAIKGQVPLSTPDAFKGVPGTVTWETDEMKKPVVLTYEQTLVPVQPRMSHNGDGKSPLWRAGFNAGRAGKKTSCTRNATDDYCRGYVAGGGGR